MSALPPWLSLGPLSLERAAPAGWTAVGVLDPLALARVDGAGLVDVAASGWALDWWIGAEDRWHLPAREPAVRQRRVGAGPVIETALRIPSGDAVHRAWAARAGGGEVVVVEVENASPTPVALALALRPYDLEGRPAGASLAAVDVTSEAVLVCGRSAVWLPRPANEAGAAVGADLVATVQAGRALRWTGPLADDAGRITAVVVYPLPHRARLRVVLPLPGAVPSAVVRPAAVADHDAVASGWGAVLDSGARVTVPDPALTDQANRSRARVLLSVPELAGDLVASRPGAGFRVAALATGGHETESLRAAAAVVDAFWRRPREVEPAVEVVGALVTAGGLADDRRVEPELTETAAGLTSLLDRRRTRGAARPAVAALAAHTRRVGQAAAAGTLTRRAGPAGADPWAWAAVPGSPEAVSAFVADASATGAFPRDDPVAASMAWLAVRRLLVVERDDALDLLPDFPPSWRGGPAEVHRLPTLFGRLSYAIRWHGYRPALLWELERRPGDRVVPLRCPGLDPVWSSTEPAGETLLAGTPDGLPPAPAEGESFS